MGNCRLMFGLGKTAAQSGGPVIDVEGGTEMILTNEKGNPIVDPNKLFNPGNRTQIPPTDVAPVVNRH